MKRMRKDYNKHTQQNTSNIIEPWSKWESCHSKWESIARMRMSGTSIVRRIWKDQNLEKTHAQNLELVVVAHPVLQGAKSQGKLQPFFLRLDWEKWSDPPPALLSSGVTSHQFPPSKPRGCKCDPLPRPVPHRRASNTSPEKCRGMCHLNHDHVGWRLYHDVFANDLQWTCWYVFSVFFQFLATKWVRSE